MSAAIGVHHATRQIIAHERKGEQMDLIYRQAAIDALHEWEMLYQWDETCREDREKVYAPSDAIKDLPTAEPERKPGRWEIRETAFEDVEAKCSCCGFVTLVNQPGNGLHMVNDLHFCPNCGASMERGEEDE